MGRLPDDFPQRVAQAVCAIGRGRVATYGQVATVCGSPRWARQVGSVLRVRGETDGMPWWRVVNFRGGISTGGDLFRPELQRRLLQKEGLVFDHQGRVRLEEHLWVPDPELVQD